MTDYNGWSNRETWNANLHLFCRDEVTQKAARKVLEIDCPRGAKAETLRGLAKALWGMRTPDGDLLFKVNWPEIVEFHYINDELDGAYRQSVAT